MGHFHGHIFRKQRVLHVGGNIYAIRLYFGLVTQTLTRTYSTIWYERITKVTLFHEVSSTKLSNVPDEIRKVV